MGPLIDRSNVERVDKVVEAALAAGARAIVRGGPVTEGSIASAGEGRLSARLKKLAKIKPGTKCRSHSSIPDVLYHAIFPTPKLLKKIENFKTWREAQSSIRVQKGPPPFFS
jgi:hypothetical protein